MTRKRSDHRSAPWGGAFGNYLLNDYLLGRDWVPDGPVKFSPEQMHETARNGSGFVHLEGGKPAMKEAWVNHLSGFPHAVVAAAIEVVRAKDPDAIAALEYYQLPEARRPSRYKWAQAHHTSEQNISEWYKRAVRRVKENLWLVRKEMGGRQA